MKGVLSDFNCILLNLQFLNQGSDANEDQVLFPLFRQVTGISATVWYLGASHLSLQMGFDAYHKVPFQTSRVERSSSLQESAVEQSDKVRQVKWTNMVAMCGASKHLVLKKVLH